MLFHRRAHPNSSSVTFIAGIGLVILASFLLIITLWLQHHTPSIPTTQNPFRVGQLVTLGSATMKINSVDYSNGKRSFPAPANQHYAIIDISITNISDSPINILPSSDMYLKQATGEIAYLTPYELDQPFRAGELLPGETIRGQISYVIPKVSSYKFYVDGIWSGGVVPFSLN